MECCLQDVAQRACEHCRVIELFCKSVLTAQRQSVTTSIAELGHGRRLEKVFSALVSKVFEYDWQRLLRPMPRPRSSVSSSTRSTLQKKTELYAGLLCVVLPAKA